MRDPLAVRVCKMAHGGVVEDSANGDGQLEDFDGNNCGGRFAYVTIHSYLDCGVYPRNQTNWHFVKEPSTFVLRVLTYTIYVGGSSSKFTVLVFKGICSVT